MPPRYLDAARRCATDVHLGPIIDPRWPTSGGTLPVRSLLAIPASARGANDGQFNHQARVTSSFSFAPMAWGIAVSMRITLRRAA
jgi:hypothetical protein